MNGETLQQLGEIAGLFARAFKKLKGVCDRLAIDVPSFGSRNSPNTEDEEESSEDMSDDNKIGEDDVLKDDFRDRVNEYVKSRRLIVGQQKQTLERYFEYMLQCRVRMDRYKNSWVYNSKKNLPKTNRRAWKKISPEQVNKIYLTLCDGFENFKDIFQQPEKPDDISKYRWRRRGALDRIKLPAEIWECKTIRNLLLKNHLELEPLR